MDALDTTPAPEVCTGKPQVGAGAGEQSKAKLLDPQSWEDKATGKTGSHHGQFSPASCGCFLAFAGKALYLGFQSFLEEISKLRDCMHDYSQLCKLAYLADIAHLNNLHPSRGGGFTDISFPHPGRMGEGGAWKAGGLLPWPRAGSSLV